MELEMICVIREARCCDGASTEDKVRGFNDRVRELGARLRET